MNIYNITGGLGNQLFQYAFCRYIEQSSECDYKFNITEYEYHNSIYELKSIFGINVKIINTKLFFNLFNFPYIKCNFLFRLYIKIIKYFELYPAVVERNILCRRSVDFTKTNVFFGYWQASYYATQIELLLRRELIFPHLTNSDAINLLSHIKSSINSTSIHIRRCDYLNHKNSSIFHACSNKYYMNAIDYIISNKGSVNLFIFSDDISWVKNNFSVSHQANYVDISDAPSHVDMQLMSNCQNNIIANSTYSWWAAWFNTNPHKIVICPSKWSTDVKTSDIALNTWKILDAD